MSLLSVIHISQFFHSFLMLSVVINFILLPKNPFFDKKNKVDGFDLPYSSKPINVNVHFLFSKIILFKSDIDVDVFNPA